MTGEFAALATALFWSWNALLFTSAGREVGSFAVNIIRLIFAVLFLAITHYLFLGNYSVSSRGFYSLALSGIIGLMLGDLTLFKAFVILGARRSLLIHASAPAFTAILAYFFLGEILGTWEILGIFITMAGIFWVMSESKDKQDKIHGSLFVGIILSVIAALCQAGGLVVAKYGLNDSTLDPLFATLIRMVAALAGVSLLMIFSKRLTQVQNAFKNRRALKFIFLGSILGPFLGVWLSMVSIKYTSTGIGATIMATTPILIIPFSMIFHKDHPSIRAITGTIIAFLGVVLLFWK